MIQKHSSTFIFDVGGTLLCRNLDRWTRAYLDAGAALNHSLDYAQTRQVLKALESELPTWGRQRQVSLEKGNGKSFWDEFHSEGFRRLGVTGDVSIFASQITDRFQRAEFEAVYDDVVPTLDTLAAHGKRLGILSNFSPNCEDVLRLVGIHRYFSFFIVSALAGVEKPNSEIFELAIQAANCPRAEIVYVGDSIYHDIAPAQRVGIGAVLIDRENRQPDFPGLRISSLRELVE